jgi:hypothetical protein
MVAAVAIGFADVRVDDARQQRLRHEREVDARRVQASRASSEPGVLLRVRMELAEDVDHVEPGKKLVVEDPARRRVRLLRPQARMRVELRPRYVPVADHDELHAACAQRGALLEEPRVPASLPGVTVSVDAAEVVIEVRLVRPVDRVDVDDRQRADLDRDDASFAVPRERVRARDAESRAHERGNAVHPSSAKRDVPRVAAEGMHAAVSR